MAYAKLNFRPGVNKENTPYTQEGGWVDSDKIRFRSGKPERINGWEKFLAQTTFGTPRASHVWRALDGTIYLALATESKVYIEDGGTLQDITPIRESQSLSNCFATTSGSNTITVTDTAHGADDGAFVTFSGSAAVGGIPDTEINAEHQITYVDANSYTITVTTNATSTVAAGGGASITADYQLNPGALDGVFQYGWGAGAWGAGTWGTPRGSGIPLDPLTWSLASWGQDLIINPRGGSVYRWSPATANNRAARIDEAPRKVNFVLITKDRHMVCFGCNQPGASGASSDLDAMQIRWSSQEDYTDWTPTAINTAGDQLLTNGTEILSAANTESQVLVWTDEQVESMQFIGPPYTFGFQQIGTSAGIVSPHAWVAYNNVIYWMGDNAFYVFQGGTSVLPCTVQKFVFDAINQQQKRKIFAGLDRENHEITWYYPTATLEDTTLNGALSASATTIQVANTAGFPSAGTLYLNGETVTYTGKTDMSFTGCSRGAVGTTPTTHPDKTAVSGYAGAAPQATEPCRYVSFNVIDQLWWVGRLERTTWEDRGALKNPLATDRNGQTFNHEIGDDADGEPIVAFIDSGDFDLGEGDSMMFIDEVIPDFTVQNNVKLYFKTRYYPLSDQVREYIGVVYPDTLKIDTRIRGRQMAFRIESNEIGDYWKYGSTRVNQRTDGKR